MVESAAIAGAPSSAASASKNVALTFPDGARREYPQGTTGLDIAKGISPSLAKRTVAMALDGKVADLTDRIEQDARIEFVSREDPRALELIRHDAAHVLAEAVQTLPALAKPVVCSAHGGPVEIVEDGVSGFLVPPGDPEALSARLTTLLVSREIREQIGRAALQRVNVFNVTQHVERVQNVYRSLWRALSCTSAMAVHELIHSFGSLSAL